jgi:hypothetical protein
MKIDQIAGKKGTSKVANQPANNKPYNKTANQQNQQHTQKLASQQAKPINKLASLQTGNQFAV